MSPTNTFATTRRVLTQLSHDKRTIALIFVVPVLLETLLRFVFDGHQAVFNGMGAPMLGLFPFTVMFVVASVATLRERTNGTLERLLTLPINKLDIVLGYALAFATLAILQSIVASAVTFGLLGLTVAGDPLWVGVIAVLNGLLGTALGLFVSAFATSEFQAVQFLPATVLPQFLLSGLIAPRDQMIAILRWASDVMPLSYSVDAMNRLTTDVSVSSAFWIDVGIISGFVVASIALGAATLKRTTR